MNILFRCLMQKSTIGSTGVASVIAIFCIGLLSGAAGGLLLGATAVVMIQALELLLEDKLLMEQLEKYIVDGYYFAIKNEVNDLQISLFAGIFGVFSSALSLTFGLYLGLSTYSLVIRKEGQGAVTKTLSVAGSVCLMGVTATGYLLGFTLKTFLSLTLWTDVPLWYIVCFAGYCLSPLLMYGRNTYLFVVLCGIVFTPAATLLLYFLTFCFNMRSGLAAVLIPVIAGLKMLENSHFLKITTAPVPLILAIADVFHITGHRIVFLQLNNSSIVLEAIFIGVFPALLWAVTVGLSLFAFCQRAEADKVFATAAGVGGAVLGVIELALPVLGPGPTLGALMGVAGAVGVCIPAAGAWTAQYAPAVGRHGFFGKVGITMGAAAGAFLSSCAHGGLSKIFLVLCAFTIPAALFLKLLILEIPFQRCNLHLFMCFLVLVVLMPFTQTTLVTIGIEYTLHFCPKVYMICLICVMTASLSIYKFYSY
ncbi:uncharacterized protein isoform X3 [Takifugu rubripes]|uniref:uncharacterized protein isoform X3 n=1 Tax=Takifugu rubripes TaxID=31033 RepID=UPI00114576CC|nr:uncharacterized protein LOC105419960 isoform X3 [Takifugu rubripes]